MLPTPEELKKIARLNVVLRTELGTNPLYAWKWGAEVGRYLVNPRAMAGSSDYNTFKDPLTGLYLPQREYTEGRLQSVPEDRWVFAMHADPGDPDMWERVFGGLVAYPPAHLRWIPAGVTSPRSQHATMLSFADIADVINNNDWIMGQVRLSRKMTGQQLLDKMEDAEERQKKAELDRAEDMIAEEVFGGSRKVYIDGGHVAGRKDHKSLPTIHLKRRKQ